MRAQSAMFYSGLFCIAALLSPAAHTETICQQMVVKHCVQVNPPQRDDEVQCLVDGAEQCGRCQVIVVTMPLLRNLATVIKLDQSNVDGLNSTEKACEPWVQGQALQ